MTTEPSSLKVPPLTSLPKKVRLVEVGPRDGLQNEKQPISTAVKIELIHKLGAAGFMHIEAASFVSPKWVPQMADGAQVLKGINRKNNVVYSALTPNLQGMQAAIEAGADEVVIFGAASEAFSQKNINCSIAESIERFKPVAQLALTNKLRLRAALSTAFGCPYQGAVPVASVINVLKQLADLGCHEIDIADTIGVATAGQVKAVMSACAKEFAVDQLKGHFHDTYGQALANILAALEVGITNFDSSIAGLGGCPYAKGATGNVASEDVVYMLHGMGIETGIDLNQLVATGAWISEQLSRPSASRAGRALWTKMQTAEQQAQMSQ